MTHGHDTNTPELRRHEDRAERGILQFAEELQAIRDGKLYPGANECGDGEGAKALQAWEAYCRDRWSMSGSRVSQIIRAVPVLHRWAEKEDSSSSALSVEKASVVATLSLAVQDAILTDAPATILEADVKAKAKAVRKEAKRVDVQEGRQASDEELIAVVEAFTPPKPKRKKHKMKGSKFIALLSQAEHHSKATADYARTNQLSDTENDFGWAFVERVRLHMDTIAGSLYQPEHVKDWDQEAAAILAGDES